MGAKRKMNLLASALLVLLVPAPLLLCCQMTSIFVPEISRSENPPVTLQQADLEGIWEIRDGCYVGNDRLVLRSDGTFRQSYANKCEDYAYETPWNEWWIERFTDGRVRMHLQGARYFISGIPLAEAGIPLSAYDPFDPRQRSSWSVEMSGELVLNIRRLPSGEIVLAHMWPSSESPLGDAETYHRVKSALSPGMMVP